MIMTALKFIFIVFCDLLIFCRITGNKIKVIDCIKGVGLSLLVAGLACFVPWTNKIISTVIIILTLLFCKFTYREKKEKPGVTFIYVTVAYAIIYSLHVVSLFIVIPLFAVLTVFGIPNETVELIAYLAADVVKFTAVFVLFKVKRFAKGMPFLRDENFTRLGCAVCIIITLSATLVNAFTDNDYVLIGAIIGYTALGVIVLMWWQNRLTMIYTQKRFAHDITTLNTQIEQQSNEIDLLKSDNDNLSAIVHKDNKLIPAMLMTVESIAASDGRFDSEIQNLIENLSQLSEERKGILKLESSKTVKFTNEPRTNAILQYFHQKACSQNVSFEVSLCGHYEEGLPCSVTYAEVCTVIADLVENAFIAVTDVPNARVRLTVETDAVNNTFELSVSDNGPAFAKKVLNYMGVKRITTRAAKGGSGIGLMTVSEIAGKYNGTLSVTEYTDGEYTKSVNVRIGTPKPQADSQKHPAAGQ